MGKHGEIELASVVWKAWFDGCCQPNPGEMQLGAVLISPTGNRIELVRPLGYGTSNQAEYSAAIAVMEAALSYGADGLIMHGDSQLVVKQVNGEWAVRNPILEQFYQKACSVAKKFSYFRLLWVPREQNKQADALSSGQIMPSSPDMSKINAVNLQHRNGNNWTVCGSNGSIYSVNIINKTCTCPDFVRNRRSLSPCKHVIAACNAQKKTFPIKEASCFFSD